MSLKIINGSLKAGEKLLLNQVSASFETGCFTAILGENGAGKSSLLNAISGLLNLHGGAVEYNGKNVLDIEAECLARTRSVLPQHSELSFPLKAIEVVRLALSFSTLSTSAQTKILEKSLVQFHAAHLKERDYLTLSGGEKQRIHLARVVSQLLAHQSTSPDKPQFVLLDEPVTALDVHQQLQTLTSVRALCKDIDVAAIAILHDVNLAAMFCDRIILMKDSEIRYSGRPEEIINAQVMRDIFNIDALIQPHPVSKTPFYIPTGSSILNSDLRSKPQEQVLIK